ncbi:Retroelement pol Polyprotein [Phytophthora cinnamomi]|uniref:Retroelement pol Polyprotein n=1 Tax=Phytophthora cinnamomi TaxID=4785 RepID=UPI0035598EBF|nr:Retroelement pol Polyprotein [Phytophthora cinnamomi]
MDGYFFPAIEFVEWKLPESHDVILGKPWFKDYNPQVDWQKEEVVIPDRMQFIDVDAPSFSHNLKEGEYEQVFRVKIQLVLEVKGIPEPIFNVVGKEYKDVFPEQLPDGLPPMREVNFEVRLKKGAQPSSRAPFRMSKMEQDSFEEFVKDKLKKGWIEVSNSPWVSNIFAIPKKDPVTGQMPKRAEWLRSGNLKIPLRWVFDYRYLNSVTVIAKIPLPLIEELFDKMVGCVIYTLIDLAQGYHQMLVVMSSRPYTAFRTHKETYQWCVAPMGVAGMPGTWSRLMHKLFDNSQLEAFEARGAKLMSCTTITAASRLRCPAVTTMYDFGTGAQKAIVPATKAASMASSSACPLPVAGALNADNKEVLDELKQYGMLLTIFYAGIVAEFLALYFDCH